MQVVDVTSDLRMLIGAPGQPYLVRAADGITLIDAGGFGQEEAIAQALKNWGERRCAAWC